MVNIIIPFSGFYNSLHEDELDRALELLLDNSRGDANNDLLNYAYDDVHWHEVMVAYAEAYVEALSQAIGIPITFKEMISPRDYNFETDRLLGEITDLDLHYIHELTPDTAFREVCERELTPRSGFIPFYSADPDDWGPPEEWDCAQCGVLLQAFVEHRLDGFDTYWEVDLMEDARSNGHITDLVYTHSGGKLKRAVRIADYLRSREERKWRP